MILDGQKCHSGQNISSVPNNTVVIMNSVANIVATL